MPKVGEQAPDFSLQKQDETTVSLADLKGKWVVLYFYPKDMTSGCTIEANDFTAANPDFNNLDGIILGVSPDSCKSHRKFIEKENLSIDLLADPDKQALQAYGVWQEKSMYGRTYMGVARTTFLIDPEGKIAEVWENVKVKGHTDQVKGRLRQLQA